jgi:hypothetical protein
MVGDKLSQRAEMRAKIAGLRRWANSAPIFPILGPAAGVHHIGDLDFVSANPEDQHVGEDIRILCRLQGFNRTFKRRISVWVLCDVGNRF